MTLPPPPHHLPCAFYELRACSLVPGQLLLGEGYRSNDEAT
eukprot:CAMPEP_0116031164 /NCGR_PEP_ID=MMETSP0321-20121206/17332_1 /TAXON_ID=163516 /ORGANISM="Leptocylindrus danicus var. danicus, Strain B650" /LENGTH=40 /DNA_ID= /DNA_START= /DNA_END= /DNA_ORIENTATION=